MLAYSISFLTIVINYDKRIGIIEKLEFLLVLTYLISFLNTEIKLKINDMLRFLLLDYIFTCTQLSVLN